MENKLKDYTRERTAMAAVYILIFSWIAAFLGPLSFVIPILILIGIPLLCWKRAFRPLVWLLLLNPLTVAFGFGVASYLQGAPHLRYMGLMSIEFYNVDPDTRCFRSTGGCVVESNEWVRDVPHNFALATLTTIFGPASRCYDGPYPSKEEAMQAVETAEPTPLDVFVGGNVMAEGKAVDLAAPMVAKILEGSAFLALQPGHDDDVRTEITAATFHDRCLVLRIRRGEADDEPEAPGGDVLILFDMKNKRPFAYYLLRQGAVVGWPPVGYLPEDE